MCRMFNLGQSVTPQIFQMEEFIQTTMEEMAQWLWASYANVQWFVTCRNDQYFACQPTCWYYDKRYWYYKSGWVSSLYFCKIKTASSNTVKKLKVELSMHYTEWLRKFSFSTVCNIQRILKFVYVYIYFKDFNITEGMSSEAISGGIRYQPTNYY